MTDHFRIPNDAPEFFAKRRAYVGKCPEKQKLLKEMQYLLLQRGAIESRLNAIESSLNQITFTPNYPGEDRELPKTENVEIVTSSKPNTQV